MKMTVAQRAFMKSFLSDFMKLQEKYYTPDNSEEYWDNVVSESMSLIEHNKTSDERQNKLCENIVLAFLQTRQ